MLDNFELRFVKRKDTFVSSMLDGSAVIHEYKILQHRTRELHSTYNGDWSEWKDIPVEDEE